MRESSVLAAPAAAEGREATGGDWSKQQGGVLQRGSWRGHAEVQAEGRFTSSTNAGRCLRQLLINLKRV